MSEGQSVEPSDDTKASATPRRWWRVPYEKIEAWLVSIRSLTLNIAFLLAFVTIVPLVVVEMFRDRVTIEPIAVPPALAEAGYTSDVVANRLWDAIQQVYDEARSAKERVSVLPSSRRVEFAIPDSGISFESLIYHVRHFFNAYETRIGGEVVCAIEPCSREALTLRLRLLRAGMDIIELPEMGSLTEEEYFTRAAAQVLRHIDPFVAANWQYDRDPDHALADLRRLVRGKHKDAKWALNLIGNIMGDRKQYADAVASYEAALALDGNYIIALGNLARVTSDMGNHAEAIGIARRALAIDPQYAAAHMVIGQAEAARGQVDAAAAAYRMAAAANPDSPWPYWRLGYLFSQAGNGEEAKKAYRMAIDIDPDFTDAYAGLALQAMLEDDKPGLLAIYREIARLKPGDANAIADVASALVMNKEHVEAIATYRKAIALQPANGKWLNDMGQLLRDQGELADAAEILSRAIAADPGLFVARFNLGDTYLRQGRKKEAAAEFRAFLELDPDSIYAPLARAWLEKALQP